MQRHYTKSALNVLNNTAKEAEALGHNYIGTEHLLLALIHTKGVASEVLRLLHILSDHGCIGLMSVLWTCSYGFFASYIHFLHLPYPDRLLLMYQYKAFVH